MNQISRISPSISAPRDYSPQQMDLIRKTVAKDTNQNEFDMFIEICRRQQLDPFKKQIHALVFNKDKEEKRQVAFITGIDGYRAIAKRAGNYRPDENEPEITYDEAKIDPSINPKGIVKAVVTLWQYAHDGWYPIRGVAHWDEFAPIVDEWENKQKTGKKKLGKENWRTMGVVMISKCAEAQALRRGWPEDTGGLYVQEEFDRAVVEMTATEVADRYQEEERIRKIGGANTYSIIFNWTDGMVLIPAGQLYDKVLAHVITLNTKEEIVMWKDMNRTTLQQYWAKEPGDALELKKAIESVIESKPAQTIEGVAV